MCREFAADNKDIVNGFFPGTFLPYLEERGLEEEWEIFNNSILLYEWSPDRIFPIVPAGRES